MPQEGGGEGIIGLCVFVPVGWSRGKKKLRFTQKDDGSATADCPVDPSRFVSSFITSTTLTTKLPLDICHL